MSSLLVGIADPFWKLVTNIMLDIEKAFIKLPDQLYAAAPFELHLFMPSGDLGDSVLSMTIVAPIQARNNIFLYKSAYRMARHQRYFYPATGA